MLLYRKVHVIILLFVVLNVVMASTALANGQPTLAQIPLELSKNASLPLSDNISLQLKIRDAKALADTLATFKGAKVVSINEKVLTVELNSRPTFSGEVAAFHTQSSFVVDNDELSTMEFIHGFTSDLQAGWKLEDMERFVSQYISEPSYVHGFNIASVVAKDRSGDCTEFAVLSTALARALELPARVVFGAAIIEVSSHQSSDSSLHANTKVSAFGHAWTEVWHDGEWQIVDAALHNAPYMNVYYLPTSSLVDEGAGFMFNLLETMSMLPEQIMQVENLQ